MLIWVYRGLSYLLAPLLWTYQRRNIARGREVETMAAERWGRASRPRPAQGRLVWVHCATIGDALAVMRVVSALLDDDPTLHVLVTTFSSKAGALLRPTLPARAVHQLLPFEYRPAIFRFLDHWRPDLVVWTESELWPAMLDILAQRKLPRVAINGKLTTKSYAAYRKFPRTMRHLLGGFEWMQVQTWQSAAHFVALGMAQHKLEQVGAIKESAHKLRFESVALSGLRAEIGARPCWLAASTHPAEFRLVHDAHRRIRQAVPDMLLLHTPRHPEAGPLVLDAAKAAGHGVALRSTGAKIGPDLAVYCCDTLGEMGLWHSLAPICFVGGTLCDFQGHNPFEAASFCNAVIHGPNVGNFPEVYTRYDAAGGAALVHDAAELAAAVLGLMHPDTWAAQTRTATALRAEGETAFARTHARLGARIAQIHPH